MSASLVGSEMCIRDSSRASAADLGQRPLVDALRLLQTVRQRGLAVLRLFQQLLGIADCDLLLRQLALQSIPVFLRLRKQSAGGRLLLAR
eukprot:9291078-Alexandrium_andersonii.AAC.1